ncbi:MAG: hypothetical protein IJU95_06855, partial [Treponema sp.]|nr:hypothetical protein [Treponema sp.]
MRGQFITKRMVALKKVSGLSDELFYLLVALASASLFCAIYGVHVLNPVYVDWCMSGGDLPQHYLGWVSFRNSPWLFPLGMTRELTYPIETSVIFTDSIPLLALPCKLLSPLLPSNFQYFGLWGISCFILQGLVSARILRRVFADRLRPFFGALIFVLSPVMIWRMYIQTSLAGHWILLLAFDAFLNPPKQAKKENFLWGAFGLLSSTVHIYFVVMDLFFLIACCIRRFLLEDKRDAFIKSALQLLSFFMPALLAVFLLGGFSTSTVSAADGLLGESSMNLNALFNPQGWSCILKDLPTSSFWQFEGFAYIGAGVILLLVLVVFQTAFLVSIESARGRWKEWLKAGLPVLLIFVAAFVLSLSHVVTLGDRVLFTIPLPGRIKKLLSIFRSTGRFSWIPVYIILVAIFKSLAAFQRKQLVSVVLVVAFLFQGYDLHDYLKGKRKNYNQIKHYSAAFLESESWKAVSDNENIRHLYFCKGFPLSDMYAIAKMVLENKKTMNRFYLAHEINEVFDTSFRDCAKKLSGDSVYIFNRDNEVFPSLYNLYYYYGGGYLLGFTSPQSGLEEVKVSPLWCYKFSSGQNLRDGRDEDGKRILQPGGLSYGPYVALPAGVYSVEIKGKGL